MKKSYILFILLSLVLTGCALQSKENPVLKSEEQIKTVSLTESIVPVLPQVKILQFGDMMLDRNVKKRIDENTPDHIWQELLGEKNDFFPNPDITTCNLEGSFANYRRKTTKIYAFQFDPALVPVVKKYGFSLFTIANNHSLDMGWAGLAEGKENLKNAEIDFYGNQLTVDDNSMLIKEVNGLRFAFIGLNDTDRPIDWTKTEQLILRAKQDADYVIINIHWGAEYQFLKSNQRQQSLAHQFIETGADVVIGHHPHVIQEIEVYQHHPIFYSLGNFVFDQYFSTETQQGLGIGMTFTGNELLAIQVFPLQSIQSQAKIMPGPESQELIMKILDKSRLAGYEFENNKMIFNW